MVAEANSGQEQAEAHSVWDQSTQGQAEGHSVRAQRTLGQVRSRSVRDQSISISELKWRKIFELLEFRRQQPHPPTMSRFPHHISDLGLFTIFGYIDERHGDLPRHSAEQKSNNSKLPSENLAGVGRSKTARGKIVNSGTGAARARAAGR